VLDHYTSTLNGKTLDEAKALLVKAGESVGDPPTNDMIEAAAKSLLKKFFNETSNLWVGDGPENSSIQDKRDYPAGWTNVDVESHVNSIKA
jgi:hypothetical protein